MIGKTLAHYEITSQLGKGGMGEVYRAKDQRLGRDVAIKVLPEEFAKDSDRVARFQREAKLLASLNHPNIASIYDLEESGGTHFLVLELIEGDTLADRIKGGPISVEESLKLALQIAEALEAAHEKGVIHRDLKPANIKVTPDGKAKVLDFGLAKAFAGERAGVDLSNSPTLSSTATQQGVILGTAAYMSPEQARGKAADKRADIWAFGVVLFEMLTGRAVFSGKDVADILAAVLRSEPDWNRLPANLHWRLRELLERCLEKEAKNRYSGIADVRVDIQKVTADPSGGFAPLQAFVERQLKWRLVLPWVAAALALGAIITGVAVWKLKPSEPRQVIRFSYELPGPQQFSNLGGAQVVAVSPDGKLFAYTTPEGLYLRSMGDWSARLLTGTEGAAYPFFSPDGNWIGYVSQSKLKKISIGGSAPMTLCDGDVDGGFSWTSDNRIIHGSGDSISWVSADGGKPEPLFEEKGNTLGIPQMLPDGKSVLFTTSATPPHKIMVHSLKSGKSKVLFEGGFARYIKTGHIVYGMGNSLYARPFNPDTLEVTGRPALLIEDVLVSSWLWHYAVSDSGTLVYMPSTTTAGNNRTLVWVDRKGKEEPIAAAPDVYCDLKISPDGTQIATSIVAAGNLNIHIWDIAHANMRQLTFDKFDNTQPLWTPDGKSIIYESRHNDGIGLYRKEVDGNGEDEIIAPSSQKMFFPNSWSSNGKILVFTEWNGTNLDICTLSMERDQAPKPLLNGKYYEVFPKISPDGQWMTYMSGESGRDEVYVRPFPEVDKGRWTVSTNGGTYPLWSGDRQDLLYWTDDALMVVPVQTTPTFRFGTPKALFQRTPARITVFGLTRIPWDISPDGKRFLMMKPPASTGPAAETPRKINIVLNWTEELKQRVPVK
jgi:serine/threonine protein kinase/Tol biopolymer transport system component